MATKYEVLSRGKVEAGYFLTEHRTTVVVTILCCILLVGVALRLENVLSKTVGQVETYVPGIPYPSGGVSDLETRLTIKDTITGVILHDQDPNPIGYYLLMLGWTRTFGTSILAIRLPSVIFGVGAIVLTYFLGSLEESNWVGLLGASAVALNGYLIYWSQLAKMYTIGCFLALLASILLLLAYRNPVRQRRYGLLYVAVTLAGLATVVYFWVLFAVHVVWTLYNAVVERTRPSTLVRYQILTLILGTPLLALAVFQARRSSYLDHNPFPSLIQYLQLGFLFVPDTFSIPPRTMPLGLGIVTLVLTIILVGYGLTGKRKLPGQRLIVKASIPWPVLVAAALGSCLVTLRLAKFTYGEDPNRTKLVIACALVVLVLPLIDLIILRTWPLIHKWSSVLYKGTRPLSQPVALSATIALLPVILLTLTAPAIPLFAPRTALLFVPYLLITVATGVTSLIQRNRGWVILLPLLATILSSSVIYNSASLFEQPVDFKSLSESWGPEIQSSDLIFIQRNYTLTPIFVYLRGDGYHFVANDFNGQVKQHPASRVWVLSTEGLPPSPEMERALTSYQAVETLSARRIDAVLYVDESQSSDSSSPPR